MCAHGKPKILPADSFYPENMETSNALLHAASYSCSVDKNTTFGIILTCIHSFILKLFAESVLLVFQVLFILCVLYDNLLSPHFERSVGEGNLAEICATANQLL